MIWLGRVCILLLALSSFNACRSKSSSTTGDLKQHHFFDELSGDSYADIFDTFTRDDRSHSEFQPVIMAHATFWNSKLREAYVHERSGRFRLGDDEARALAVEELQENEAYLVFLVSVATREFEWNDIERPTSMWRVFLSSVDGKLQAKPESIKVVNQKDEVSRYFYKYMDNFTRTYRIRFPREAFRDLHDFSLQITGVRGNLKFEFKNDSPAPAQNLESQ